MLENVLWSFFCVRWGGWEIAYSLWLWRMVELSARHVLMSTSAPASRGGGLVYRQGDGMLGDLQLSHFRCIAILGSMSTPSEGRNARLFSAGLPEGRSAREFQLAPLDRRCGLLALSMPGTWLVVKHHGVAFACSVSSWSPTLPVGVGGPFGRPFFVNGVKSGAQPVAGPGQVFAVASVFAALVLLSRPRTGTLCAMS